MEKTKENLTKYGNQELSLRVFNDEVLYKQRHRPNFFEDLKIFFIFNDEQEETLKQDLKEDLNEQKIKPTLTKKDFKKVAEILRKIPNTLGMIDKARETITKDFIKWFKSENLKFNEKKFREAVFKE